MPLTLKCRVRFFSLFWSGFILNLGNFLWWKAESKLSNCSENSWLWPISLFQWNHCLWGFFNNTWECCPICEKTSLYLLEAKGQKRKQGHGSSYLAILPFYQRCTQSMQLQRQNQNMLFKRLDKKEKPGWLSKDWGSLQGLQVEKSSLNLNMMTRLNE